VRSRAREAEVDRGCPCFYSPGCREGAFPGIQLPVYGSRILSFHHCESSKTHFTLRAKVVVLAAWGLRSRCRGSAPLGQPPGRTDGPPGGVRARTCVHLKPPGSPSCVRQRVENSDQAAADPESPTSKISYPATVEVSSATTTTPMTIQRGACGVGTS
jgi:hypothetical protein